MDKLIKEEELQSRREFFKKAAKAALPVVGAVVLSSLPIGKTEAATGCTYMTCANTCLYDCKTTCEYRTCKGTCTGSCKTTSKNY